MCCINAHVGLIAPVLGCAQHYMPPSGLVGVPSLWHHYLGGHRLKVWEPLLYICGFFGFFLVFFTSSMVLLWALSGLSLRFQRCDLWLRPPSSSLSVVSCRATRGRLRLRELIRWREPGSWSLNQSGLKAQGRTTTTLKLQGYCGWMCMCLCKNLQSVSSISASASLSPWGSDSTHSSCREMKQFK